MTMRQCILKKTKLLGIIYATLMLPDSMPLLLPIALRPPTVYILIGHFSRMCFPYLNSKAGTGINATAKKPSILFPHPSPIVSYMLGPASGSRAPNKQRSAVMPAIAEAAYCGKQSIMYVCKGAKMPIRPTPKGTSEMMGTIQCTL